MICPNCSYVQKSGLPECKRCGIIFTKFYTRQKENGHRINTSNKKNDPPQGPEPFNSKLRLLFYVKEETNLAYWIARVLLLAALVWLSIGFISSPIQGNSAGNSFMHLINLPFHEAGHVFLRPFGPLLTSLGGSLFQLLVPIICGVVLLLQTRDTFGASVSLWWFGQNFFDMAPYINDARSLSLPLVGGNFGHSSPYGFHDWEFILSETGLLHYDHFLARISVCTGTLVVMTSLVWGTFILYKQLRNL